MTIDLSADDTTLPGGLALVMVAMAPKNCGEVVNFRNLTISSQFHSQHCRREWFEASAVHG